MERGARSAAQREMMLGGDLLKVIPLLAAPQIITMLVDTFYNIADAYFVSRIGGSAIAAVGINDSVMHLIRSMSLAFGVGCASYSSRLLGAGEDETVSRVASTTLFSAMGIIGMIALVSSVFMSPILGMLGAIDSVKGYSMEYGRWILSFSPFTAASVVLSQTLRSEGSSKLSMFGQVTGCIVNLALDPLFIYGFGWGVAGAAIATGVSKMISVAVLSSHFLRGLTVIRISPSLFAPRAHILAEVARMGAPAGIRSSGLAVANIVINNLAGAYGEMALAAVSVANKCMKLVSSVILGLGQGYHSNSISYMPYRSDEGGGAVATSTASGRQPRFRIEISRSSDTAGGRADTGASSRRSSASARWASRSRRCCPRRSRGMRSRCSCSSPIGPRCSVTGWCWS